jgi:hypothetical protein
VDHFPGDITIGGLVPAALVNELCLAIREAGVGGDWDAGGFEPYNAADLLAGLQRGHLWLCHCSATGGMFDELEKFLQQHGIAFDRRSDPFGGEYDGEQVSFRPADGTRRFVTDTDGHILVPQETAKHVLALIAAGDGAAAAEMLGAAAGLDVPALAAFAIEGDEGGETNGSSIS